MRLDFNVLWVEDQPDRVRAQRDKLDFLVRKEGFRLSARFAASVSAAKLLLSDHIFNDHVDLVLMDYDLGAGPRGDVGLMEVREIIRYKEIVFYSAQSQDLRAILNRTGVDGVYISSREDLPMNVDGIFQMLVKKVLDIEHSRGIVMGATSDIDYFVNKCLMSLFEGCDDQNRARILKQIAVRLEEIRARFDKDMAALIKAVHVSEVLPKYAIYTSVDRVNLLREALTLLKVHDDKSEALKQYVYKTIPRRNDLAHVSVAGDGFVRKLYDRSGKELSIDEMRELRLALLQARELFEDLARSM